MGGQKAQFTTEQSVNNLIYNVLSKVVLSDTGKFLNFDGLEHLGKAFGFGKNQNIG